MASRMAGDELPGKKALSRVTCIGADSAIIFHWGLGLDIYYSDGKKLS